MSVANVRCVMVPTEFGLRLRLMPASELLALERKGKAVRIGKALWQLVEATDKATPDPVPPPPANEPPAPPPVEHPQTRNANKTGQNKRDKGRHGSRAK